MTYTLPNSAESFFKIVPITSRYIEVFSIPQTLQATACFRASAHAVTLMPSSPHPNSAQMRC